VGADWHDNCTPNCAEGTYSSYRANVHLDRPRVLGSYWLFTRMTVTYTDRRPPYPIYQKSSSWTMHLEYSRQYDTYLGELLTGRPMRQMHHNPGRLGTASALAPVTSIGLMAPAAAGAWGTGRRRWRRQRP
jgi:hypothetical protein